ncbi:MAG: two-component system response regulator, partial [Rhodomicrobium sp.]
MSTLAAAPEASADNSLLIVDDDKPFLNRLAKAMEARGY